MNEKKIQFFTEDISYHIRKKESLRGRIVELVRLKNYHLGNVNIIFCSDRFLRKYNKKYLDHDYYTDVIAFDLSEHEKELSGDIYISLDRIRENAKEYGIPVGKEIARVIIHGMLHLCGMSDSTEELKSKMRQEENKFISGL